MSLPYAFYRDGALSLKGRLLIGLFVTWLVVLALLLGFGWRSAETLASESSHTHLRYEARLIADELTQQADARLSALQRLAGRMPLRASGEEARNVLRSSDALLEWFEGMIVVDAQGRVMADWPNVKGRVGLSIAERDYFQEAAAFKQPLVSEPFFGRASRVPLVLFVVPRVDVAGNFRGLIGGVVNLRDGGLFNRLARIRLGLKGYASVHTASGYMLYHPDRSRVLSRAFVGDDASWVNLSLYGWEGEVLGQVSSGELAYQAYRQIWPADWIVRVVLPRDQVMSPLLERVWRLGWWALLMAALLMPIMGWLVWLSLRPLYRLERQLEEIGQGKRRQVALGTRMQELQRVAQTFNRVEAERGEALARARERQAYLDAILSSSPMGIFVTDAAGEISYANEALIEMIGHPEVAHQPAAWLERVHADDRQAMLDLWQHSLRSGEDFLQQYRYQRNDEWLWLEVHARRVFSAGKPLGFVGTVKDITQRREEEAMRQWEAEHDPLTGLLNRRGLERRLEEALADWRKRRTPSALLLFDMDHFKPINDIGGHALGDEMLCQVARVLTETIRRSDHAARQGGDEFVVLLPSCTMAQAERIAQALCEAVQQLRVMHGDQSFGVTLSIGVTRFEPDDQRVSSLMQRADEACYQAKHQGRNQVVVHAVS